MGEVSEIKKKAIGKFIKTQNEESHPQESSIKKNLEKQMKVKEKETQISNNQINRDPVYLSQGVWLFKREQPCHLLFKGWSHMLRYTEYSWRGGWTRALIHCSGNGR